MKYFVKNHRVGSIEHMGHELLLEVLTRDRGRGNIKLTLNNCDGWIFDADESFDLFCMIKCGFQPAYITDEEYVRLTEDKIVFLSKARTVELAKASSTMIPKRR